MTKIGHIRLLLYTNLSLIVAGGLLLSACGDNGPDEPPELKRAAAVVRYMASANQLKRSSFYVVYPEGKPSQFVSWMFSTFGTAEWPPAEDSDEYDALEGAKALGIPVIPKDVLIVANKPDPSAGKQVVVRSDDQKSAVIVEGYLKPEGPPVLTRQWELPSP